MHERSASAPAACLWLGALALLATADAQAASVERVALLVAGERGAGPLATHRETALCVTRVRSPDRSQQSASGRAAAVKRRVASFEDGRVDD